jgi:hypothetical protein
MRKLLMMLGVMALICSPAMAGKNANGSLVVHTHDSYVWTYGVCDFFDYWYGDITCPELDTRTDRDPNTPALIWFLAALPDESAPAVSVVYFGHDHSMPQYYHNRWGYCGPAGTLEVPDAGWPDFPTTAGNSVAFGTPIAGDILFPFYYFDVWGVAGWHYCTSINPVGGYAGYVDDSNPPELDYVECFGCAYWHTDDGYNECPPCGGPPMGACCIPDGTCVMTADADECFGLGGWMWMGQGITCDPNPCPQPGACCYPDGSCVFILEDWCGEVWYGEGVPCDPNPCPLPQEACCLDDGSCIFTDPDGCEAAGGRPWGPGTICDPNPCPPPYCEQEDDGTGTVALPPLCTYLSPYDVHMILEGLPPGTTIELDPIHHNFFNIERYPGGVLGGEIEVFDSELRLIMSGTGELEDLPRRSIVIPLPVEVHTGPRTPGDCVQEFPALFYRAQGGIAGDPDFEQLTITAGDDFGLPSPGETILTELDGGGLYNVDSFFDITYQIDFVGAVGSMLEGMAGTTIGTIQMSTGMAVDPTGACCDEDGNCTVTLEAECPYDIWLECEVCDPNPCPVPLGACCYGCEECIVLPELECYDLPDDYDWILDEVCEPNPCPPIATETTTWGRIKSTYK